MEEDDGLVTGRIDESLRQKSEFILEEAFGEALEEFEPEVLKSVNNDKEKLWKLAE